MNEAFLSNAIHHGFLFRCSLWVENVTQWRQIKAGTQRKDGWLPPCTLMVNKIKTTLQLYKGGTLKNLEENKQKQWQA